MNAIEIAATMELKIVPVGSRVTCDPPPMDTDADYLVLADDGETFAKLETLLAQDGWELGGSDVGDGSGDGWVSWRKDIDNLIVCYQRPIYDYFLAATACAKRLNLQFKVDRVALFVELEQHWPGLLAKQVADSTFDLAF